MRLATLLPIAVAMAMGACAAVGSGVDSERNAQLRLDRGLAAFDAGQYAEAFDDLAWVYVHCSNHQAGVEALTALSALEIDPRNPAADPGVGVDLLGRLIRAPARSASQRLAESTFLVSLALGAPHPDSAGSDTTATLLGVPAWRAASDPILAALTPIPDGDATLDCGLPTGTPVDSMQPLPRLPGFSMARMLASAEAARDSATTRVDSLTIVLAAVQEQLNATREELERIRKTLKP